MVCSHHEAYCCFKFSSDLTGVDGFIAAMVWYDVQAKDDPCGKRPVSVCSMMKMPGGISPDVVWTDLVAKGCSPTSSECMG